MMTDIDQLVTIPFTFEDCQRAWDEWKCNCGPSACAAILGKTLDEIRGPAMQVGFADNGYISPTMMKKLIAAAGGRILSEQTKPAAEAWTTHGLNRVQWCGPWTEPGMNPRWAYGHTHWVASWIVDGRVLIFDINSGVVTLDIWREHVVKAILATVKRNNGRWFVTHSWEL